LIFGDEKNPIDNPTKKLAIQDRLSKNPFLRGKIYDQRPRKVVQIKEEGPAIRRW
jgi:hypothetical protein